MGLGVPACHICHLCIWFWLELGTTTVTFSLHLVAFPRLEILCRFKKFGCMFRCRLVSQHDIGLVQALRHDPLYADLLQKIGQSEVLQEKLMERTSALQVVFVVV